MTSESKELIEIEAIKAENVFCPGGVENILELIKEKSAIANPDITTDKGRSEIASMAYKIARTKTGLDELGKELVADQKKKLAVIDERRKLLRDELDAHKAEVRKPLTDYEDKEAARLEGHNSLIQRARDYLVLSTDTTAQDIQDRLEALQKLGDRDFQEFQCQFDAVKENSFNKLSERLAQQIKIEEDAAELERLRAESAARKAADAEIERQKQADERAKAAAEQMMKDAAEREAKEKAEIASAEAKRAANKEHRKKINNEILADFITHGFTEESGKAIIGLIAQGKIKHVTINY